MSSTTSPIRQHDTIDVGQRFIPSASDLTTALAHTTLLVRWRWRLVRNGRAKALMITGALLAFLMLFMASSLGELVRWLAESAEARDTAAGDFAVGYLVAFKNGNFGSMAAFALGTAVAASIFGPLTGSANLSLAPAEDLSTLRLHRLHRYFDSLILQAFSTIGALQLLSLTTVASLLTMDGANRAYALLLTWSAWLVLVFLTTAEGWVIETVYRRYGMRLRFILGSVLAAIVAAAIWFDPDHGTTFFGVGVHYASALQGDINAIPVWAPFAICLAAVAALAFAGSVLCNAALNRPAAPARTANGKTGLLARIGMSSNPNIALTQMTFKQMFRTQAVARPIIVVLAMAIPAVWITRASVEASTTLVLATPLAVALGWTANAFGVFGPGMTWLQSLPKVSRRLPAMIFGTSIATVAVIFLISWLPALLLGRIEPLKFGAAAAGMAVATLMMTRSGLSKAIHKPHLARLGTRGDAIVPPLTAINYTMRFALFSGQLGILVFSQDRIWLQWLCVLGFTVWVGVRFWTVQRSWANRSRQAQLTAIVAAG